MHITPALCFTTHGFLCTFRWRIICLIQAGIPRCTKHHLPSYFNYRPIFLDYTSQLCRSKYLRSVSVLMENYAVTCRPTRFVYGHRWSFTVTVAGSPPFGVLYLLMFLALLLRGRTVFTLNWKFTSSRLLMTLNMLAVVQSAPLKFVRRASANYRYIVFYINGKSSFYIVYQHLMTTKDVSSGLRRTTWHYSGTDCHGSDRVLYSYER